MLNVFFPSSHQSLQYPRHLSSRIESRPQPLAAWLPDAAGVFCPSATKRCNLALHTPYAFSPLPSIGNDAQGTQHHLLPPLRKVFRILGHPECKDRRAMAQNRLPSIFCCCFWKATFFSTHPIVFRSTLVLHCKSKNEMCSPFVSVTVVSCGKCNFSLSLRSFREDKSRFPSILRWQARSWRAKR